MYCRVKLSYEDVIYDVFVFGEGMMSREGKSIELFFLLFRKREWYLFFVIYFCFDNVVIVV